MQQGRTDTRPLPLAATAGAPAADASVGVAAASAAGGAAGTLTAGRPGGERTDEVKAPKRRVLIVEDEALIALDLKRRLTRMGLEVTGVADNRDDAVAICSATKPDLVLMDICIRGPLDGVATAHDVNKIRDVPIIFLTAYADDGTVRRAAEAAPYGYLLKPFDDKTLSATITVALERHAMDNRMRLLTAAVETAKIGILLIEVAGPERRIAFANDAFLGLVGATREQVIGNRPCFLATDPEDPGVLALQQALDGLTPAESMVEYRRMGSDQRAWTSVTMSPILNRAGEVTHMLVFHVDITSLRDSERALEVSQRLVLTGRMASGIASDFNDILSTVASFTQFALGDLEDTARRNDLVEVLNASWRGAGLTRKLLEFSRKPEATRAGHTNVAEVLGALRSMAERMLVPGAELVFRLDPTAMAVTLDPQALEQILLNLVSNACDAMPSGGRVTIIATRPPEPSGHLEGGHYIRLQVSDEGVGMAAEVMARAFEPLYTTKLDRHGGGIGLSTSKALIDRHGGLIALRSTPGAGTTVTVELPMPTMAVGTEVQGAQTASAMRVDGRGARCLVVEDDAAVRRACERALGAANFHVTGAPSVVLALRELERPGAELDLLICDMSLLTGEARSLVTQARALGPHVSVLITTGTAEESDDPVFRGADFIWKPFAVTTLVRRAADLVTVTREAPPARPLTREIPRVTGGSPPSIITRRPGDTQRAAVLVVDPDDASRSAILETLGELGIQAVAAKSVAEARELRSEEPTVCIVDLQSESGGVPLLEELRGRIGTVGLGLVDQLDLGQVQGLLRARFQSVLMRPLDASQLRQEIERALMEGQVERVRRQLQSAHGNAPRALADPVETSAQLDDALAQLFVVFQPLVRSFDGSIYAYEALMRTRSAALPGPAHLLAAAEALGRIEELGRAVRVCVADVLLQGGHHDAPIFVNLHPLELRSDLLTAASEPLLPFANRIVIEVTERAQLTGQERLEDTLARLRGVGFRVALDDLGEGYAGLSWLVKLNPEFAKIDMSLVRDIHTSRIKRGLVASLVSVCRRAGTVVVAEGIEVEDEARALLDLGCDILQGYFFAKPGLPFPTVRPWSPT